MKEFIFKISCRSLEKTYKRITRKTIVVNNTKAGAVHRLEKCRVTILDYVGSRPITRANLYHASILETEPYETGR